MAPIPFFGALITLSCMMSLIIDCSFLLGALCTNDANNFLLKIEETVNLAENVVCDGHVLGVKRLNYFVFNRY